MRFQLEEFSEFVQGADMPPTSLLNTHDLNQFHDLWHVLWTKRGGNILRAVGKDFDKVSVVIFSLIISRQTCDLALFRIAGLDDGIPAPGFIKVPFPVVENAVDVIAFEYVAIFILDPLGVSFAYG